MDQNVVVMDFSHVYEREDFYLNKYLKWIDCTHILSTDGFVSDSALKELRMKIEKMSVHGIHFIDNGNYHYMTKLWIEKIQEPFCLVVFDHHSDMQKSLFADIMSCGSWILDALKDNQYLKKVVLVGVSSYQLKSIPQEYLDRIAIIEDQMILAEDVFLLNLCGDYPIYISIDKDVLSPQEVMTTWDQGIMTMQELKYYLLLLLQGKDVIGMDVSGDCQAGINYFKEERQDNRVNQQILSWIKHFK